MKEEQLQVDLQESGAGDMLDLTLKRVEKMLQSFGGRFCCFAEGS